MATDPAQIVVDIYNIAILLGGFLAFLMIVYGGIRYALSGANPSGASEGRDAITQALYGLLLLFLSYTILNTINPNLVKNLGFPDFERLTLSEPGSNITSTTCNTAQAGPASVDSLREACFGDHAEQASAIALVESGGDRFKKSGVDLCKDGTAFSVGLFQINILANATLADATTKAAGGTAACAGLFVKNGAGIQGTCLDHLPSDPRVCNRYDCELKSGTNGEAIRKQYQQCVQNIADYGVQMACKLSNNGANWQPWAYTKAKCGF
jgi:hypothetical protein